MKILSCIKTHSRKPVALSGHRTGPVAILETFSPHIFPTVNLHHCSLSKVRGCDEITRKNYIIITSPYHNGGFSPIFYYQQWNLSINSHNSLPFCFASVGSISHTLLCVCFKVMKHVMRDSSLLPERASDQFLFSSFETERFQSGLTPQCWEETLTAELPTLEGWRVVGRKTALFRETHCCPLYEICFTTVCFYRSWCITTE